MTETEPDSHQNAQTKQLAQKLKTKSIHILQLGDSHTAADYLTDAARNHLQQVLGNGGPGWAMPVHFAGMRLARFSYPEQQGWQTFSSRTQPDQNYTLGGLNAQPQPGARLELNATQPENLQTISLNLRQGPNDDDLDITDAHGQQFKIGAAQKNNQWQFARFNAYLPLKITTGLSFQTVLGGWWLHNQNNQGAVYSALGINGAQLDQWHRWNTQAWQQTLNYLAPDLIILAYGTNEAYNDQLNIDTARTNLIESIKQIRTASPHSAIMILGAPESLKNTAGPCGNRPLKLSAFQTMQKEIARSQHTLYWDWQAEMGGECSMNNWIRAGLGRPDGIHFTKAGYQKLGVALAKAILALQN